MASLNWHKQPRWIKTAVFGIAILVSFIVGWQSHLGRATFNRFFKPAVTREHLAQQLDGSPFYQAMKRADPEAYSRLVSEVTKSVINGASASEIEILSRNHTAASRRKNADAAVAASPTALAVLMKTLSDITDYLHGRDEGLCAEFALHGLASEQFRGLGHEADFMALLQVHGAAVFDAIADGRGHPEAFQPEPLTAIDFELAVQGLQKRGWTDQMRAVFAESGQLRTLPPELVCRMQREWLATLATLPEPTRTRFYRQMIGPMLRS